ncbi:MAG: FeoB-associated Cys-rich membrane protein [Treponema sp.]|jgi:hypothetical protein|nr:FeoB-associated Cys-rich membrane protein [Treponema sp.]
MEFLKTNAGNIIVGFIVFAILISLTVRLILNIRKGKTGCACGCGSCPKRGERAAKNPGDFLLDEELKKC